ncbi:MAG: transketolase [Candidatus Scatomorpha sp.]|jgi:transketolase
MNEEKIAMLKERAKQLRKTAVTMIYEAQSGHPGGSLSAADMVAALYFSEMHIDPQNPNWADRDRFVLSKGHVCPILYSALGILGYFPESVLHTLRQEGSMLQGHPSMLKCPGIDISTGSLGQGAACAVGMALAGKRDGKDYRVFTMVGDGEMNEGIIWEAMMCANKYKLDNYIMLFDNNGLQLDGTTDQIMPGLDMSKKAADFGFDVYEIDGHDMAQILDAFDKIRAAKNGKPKFINAHTVKGKGVDYMENSLDWHGKAPNKEQYESAMEQLERGI